MYTIVTLAELSSFRKTLCYGLKLSIPEARAVLRIIPKPGDKFKMKRKIFSRIVGEKKDIVGVLHEYDGHI